jgi:molybdenum cofactor synthesis domain-containing protein
LITLEEAQAEVLAACHPLGATTVEVASAAGLVLAAPVTAAEPVPPFRNTAMDGYAVRAGDTAGASAEAPVRLHVVGTRAAGPAGPFEVGPGEALRIMTGAAFPDGADAVAIVEDTVSEGDRVMVLRAAESGVHIREAGGDVAAGQALFPAGTALGAGHIGVLSSVGRLTVEVVPAPRVGVLSTGDELVEGPGVLEPGQIRDSNRPTLMQLLRRDGFVPIDLGIARDDEKAIEAALRDAVSRCDAVLTSGGVSMGDFDYVKAVLDRIGRMRWMQVAIRPAKPFAFGTVDSVPVFGLPGNPVSSMVSYEVLARPGLRRLAGFPDAELHHPVVPAVVEGDGWRGAGDGRTSYVRVRSRFGPDGRLRVASSGGQASHQLFAMALADALAVTPPAVQLGDGDEVGIIRLGP